MSLHTPDLTKFPPRSPRVRLGGYAILPRMLGIDPEALKKELHRSDTEVLAWIKANAKHKRTTPEIMAWTAWQEHRAPDNTEGREYLNELHKAGAPAREDIVTWFDVLDMDDYVSFGGKA